MRKIVITPVATRQLDEVVLYLDNRWSVKIRKEFLEKLSVKLDTLKEFPEIGRLYDDSDNTRCMVLFKQITMYYQFSTDEIKILAFFDSRKRPDRIVKILQ